MADYFDIDYEAQIMACDYINSKLRKSCLRWHKCPDLPWPSNLRLMMRSLGEESELHYGKV